VLSFPLFSPRFPLANRTSLVLHRCPFHRNIDLGLVPFLRFVRASPSETRVTVKFSDAILGLGASYLQLNERTRNSH
jgi:hypothetical protein